MEQENKQITEGDLQSYINELKLQRKGNDNWEQGYDAGLEAIETRFLE